MSFFVVCVVILYLVCDEIYLWFFAFKESFINIFFIHVFFLLINLSYIIEYELLN